MQGLFDVCSCLQPPELGLITLYTKPITRIAYISPFCVGGAANKEEVKNRADWLEITVSKFECLDKKNCTLNFMMEIIKY